MTTDIKDSVSPQTAADWLARGEAILIDVREPDEFKSEHIPAAASIPLGTLAATLPGLAVPAGRKVIMQCLKGGRGEQACRVIASAELGNDIYNLAGGLSAWKGAGLPVTSAEANGAPPIFRQVQIAVGLMIVLAVLIGFTASTAAFAVAGLIGAMLAIAGITGWCGLALLLARMPWNRPA